MVAPRKLQTQLAQREFLKVAWGLEIMALGHRSPLDGDPSSDCMDLDQQTLILAALYRIAGQLDAIGGMLNKRLPPDPKAE